MILRTIAYWLLGMALMLYICEGKSLDSLSNDKTLTRIAFGSCNRHDSNQRYWDAIGAFNPELFIWLGDIVYADTMWLPAFWYPSPISVVQNKYSTQKINEYYHRFNEKIPITGAWDDHDFNHNNGGSNYDKIQRDQVQQILLDFLDEPKNSTRWKQEGVYTSKGFGTDGKKIKLIILDTRYFRDDDPEGQEHSENDILGPAQWKWLENEIKHSDAQINIITSGIQVLPDDKPIQEKWANFPRSRTRLLKLIRDYKLKGALLLSGDIHYSEILKTTCEDTFHPLFEVTSSGLTHCCDDLPICQKVLDKFMTSDYHIEDFVAIKSFGTLIIDWESAPVKISIQLRDLSGDVKVSHDFVLTENYQVDEICKEPRVIPNWVFSNSEKIKYYVFAILFAFLVSIISLAYLAISCCRKKPNKSKIS